MGRRRKTPSAFVMARRVWLVARLRRVTWAAGTGRGSFEDSRTLPSSAEVWRACWRGMRWGGAGVFGWRGGGRRRLRLALRDGDRCGEGEREHEALRGAHTGAESRALRCAV